ncbi:DUF397 domain-containing protein [Nocardiopsis sp. HUAS JQ3]|uniref:DUF397 domain-containing protein n=1 Tax=Nocardiopsis sp. HUAS JQ3 TaxID=3061629 RepID=UPI0023A9D2A2|nr:DUF397 domain-containing protein [Nocardiopsis sp. HUAS JQ3]WDZ92688.1 DUF397 domain-containing protein [Nocardiopsis sp. HUAS JQ3]
MTTALDFRKSSYSGHAQNCVEVAQIPTNFRKSSYNGETGGNCVEVAHLPTDFRKSSYSGQTGGNCVEVADLPCGAAIRDSKHPDAGHLPFPATEWTGFLNAALSQ